MRTMSGLKAEKVLRFYRMDKNASGTKKLRAGVEYRKAGSGSA
jgi:hypothetical protein